MSKHFNKSIVGPTPSFRNGINFQNVIFKHSQTLPTASQLVIKFVLKQDNGSFDNPVRFFVNIGKYINFAIKYPTKLAQSAGTDYCEKILWLEKNIGEKGKEWDARWSRKEFAVYYIGFKHKENAVRFKLVFHDG